MFARGLGNAKCRGLYGEASEWWVGSRCRGSNATPARGTLSFLADQSEMFFAPRFSVYKRLLQESLYF
jgi:hypothetical protein